MGDKHNIQQQNTKNFIRGGQIILHNFRMFNQIATRVFLLGFAGFLLFLFAWIFLRTTPYERYVLGQWCWAQMYVFLNGNSATQTILQPNGISALVSSHQLLISPLMKGYFSRMMAVLLSGILVSAVLSIFITLVITIFLKKRGKNPHPK